MSNSAAVLAAPAVTRNPSEDGSPTRSHRTERSAGKGRRRRAVAEQRRAEQQQWSHLMHDTEEELYVAPPRPPASRRQLRRAARRSSHEDWEADRFDEDEEDNLHIALALALSLSEPGNNGQTVMSSMDNSHMPVDMSYESLVMLENVKCVAPPPAVNCLMGHVYEKGGLSSSTESLEELCTICQVEYKDKDRYILTPCLHTFHDVCGSEWFLNHSKLCPVCKHDVTDEA